MKRISPLLLTLALPAFATPAAQAANPAVVPAPVTAKTAFDPAARSILHQAALAYGHLKGLKVHYESFSVNAGNYRRSVGDVAFARPNQAKISVKIGASYFLLVTDGRKIYAQHDLKTYQVDDAETGSQISEVLGNIPSLLNLPLSIFATGKSPLSTKMKWQSAKLLADNAVTLVLHENADGPTYKFNLYFDATDHLLRRVEIYVTTEGESNIGVTNISKVEINPDFAPGTFSYKPAPGLKLFIPPPMFSPKLKVGTRPFPLQGNDLNGKPQTWEQYHGKVVLLDFWATWCGPCRAELPNVLANYRKYHKAGFDIIGVSLDDDKPALLKFIKKEGMTYPELFDGKGWNNATAKKYEVLSIPFSLLIGKDGKIVAVSPRAEKLEPAIVKALAK